MIKLYDKVKLKSGETANIVEIYERGVAYEADINRKDGSIDTDTIKQEDIECILKQYKRKMRPSSQQTRWYFYTIKYGLKSSYQMISAFFIWQGKAVKTKSL